MNYDNRASVKLWSGAGRRAKNRKLDERGRSSEIGSWHRPQGTLFQVKIRQASGAGSPSLQSDDFCRYSCVLQLECGFLPVCFFRRFKLSLNVNSDCWLHVRICDQNSVIWRNFARKPGDLNCGVKDEKFAKIENWANVHHSERVSIPYNKRTFYGKPGEEETS